MPSYKFLAHFAKKPRWWRRFFLHEVLCYKLLNGFGEALIKQWVLLQLTLQKLTYFFMGVGGFHFEGGHNSPPKVKFLPFSASKKEGFDELKKSHSFKWSSKYAHCVNGTFKALMKSSILWLYAWKTVSMKMPKKCEQSTAKDWNCVNFCFIFRFVVSIKQD